MIGSTGRYGLALAIAVLAAIAAPAGAAPGARAQEAASAVQDVALENVVLTFGDTTLTIPSLTVSGTRLSKETLLAILQSGSSEAWSARLQRLDASSLSAPALRIEQVDGSKRQIAEYRDVTAKGVHGGRIAEFSAVGATVKIEGGPHPGSGSYGRIRAEDVDLAGMARLYAEAGDGKGPHQRIYAGFSVEDIAFSDDESDVTIGSLGGRDFSGRQLPMTWNGAMTALGALDGSSPDVAERAKASGIAAELLDAFSVGSLEIARLGVKSKKDEKADMAIARIAYASSGTDQGLTLTDLAFTVDDTRATVGGLRVTGFSLEPTIATLKRIAKTPETSEAELRRLTPTIGTVSLTGIGVDLPPGAAELPESSTRSEGDAPDTAVPESPRLRLGLRDVSMTFGPPKEGVPTSGRLSVSGLTLPASALASLLGIESLETYGYRDLDLSFVADTTWNQESKELAVKEVSVSGKDMGTLRLNATLGGISPDLLDPSSVTAGLAMLSASAKALDLTLENGGLMERFIAAQAKSLSLEPDELRREYVTASVIGIPVILGNSSAAKSIGAAMGQFVTKPGMLSFTARPKNGSGLGMVDFTTIGTPGAMLDKLDVTAKAQ